jgi:uncharacterized membrane protein
VTLNYNDDPKLNFVLIVAIVGAALWLRNSMTPPYGLLVIAIPAAGWMLYRAKRDWRR